MRRTLGIAAAFVLLLGGAAFAHPHGGGGGGYGGGGAVVRDHRGPAPVVRSGGYGGGAVVRDHRGGGPAVVSHVRVSNGRYVFPGGVVRTYRAPVIRAHYYDMRVRPALIVESYEPVPGYVWMAGSWSWGGREWVWAPGYWSAAEAPVVTGGVGVSAGVTIW